MKRLIYFLAFIGLVILVYSCNSFKSLKSESIFECITNNDSECVERILKQDSNVVNILNERRETPLVYLVNQNHVNSSLLGLLLDYKSDIYYWSNDISNDAFSTLMELGEEKMLNMLYEKTDFINTTNEEFIYWINLSLLYQRQELLKNLLELADKQQRKIKNENSIIEMAIERSSMSESDFYNSNNWEISQSSEFEKSLENIESLVFNNFNFQDSFVERNLVRESFYSPITLLECLKLNLFTEGILNTPELENTLNTESSDLISNFLVYTNSTNENGNLYFRKLYAYFELYDYIQLEYPNLGFNPLNEVLNHPDKVYDDLIDQIERHLDVNKN